MKHKLFIGFAITMIILISIGFYTVFNKNEFIQEIKDSTGINLQGIISYASSQTETTSQWLTHGRNLNRTNFYPERINTTGFSELWVAHNVSGGRSSPVGSQGIVITTGNKHVSALNATTGSVIWNRTFVGGNDADATISGGKVYAVDYAGGAASNLSVFNIDDGSFVCNASTDFLSSRASVAIIDDVIFAPRESDLVQTFNATTCEYIADLGVYSYYGGISVGGGRGYVQDGILGNATISAFNMTDYTTIWNHSYSNAVAANAYPTYANDKLYYGDDDGFFFILNATNGNQVCNYTTGTEGISSKSVGIGFGMAIFESENWTLHSVNNTNCNEIWNFSLSQHIGDASPVITSNGLVFTAGYDNYTRLINITTGTEIQNYTAQSHRGAVSIMKVGSDTLGFQSTYAQAQLGNNNSLIAYNLTPVSTLSVSQNAPGGNYVTSNSSILFNCTATENTYSVDNLTLFIDDVSNFTNTTAGTTITLERQVDSISEAPHNWSCQGTNNQNEVLSTGNSAFTIQGFDENSQTFNQNTTVGATELYSINITYNDDTYSNVRGTLYYNGTAYTGTKIGSGKIVLFNKSLIVPSFTTQSNVSFYWEIGLWNGSWNPQNSTTQSQTVNVFNADNCSTNTNLLYNFTIKDEKTQTTLNPSTQNTTANLELNVFSRNRLINVTNFSQSYSKVNSFSICLDNNLSGVETFSLDLELEYFADGYANEYYNLQNVTLNSSSFNKNITLYNLDNVSAQKFVINYKDGNLLPVEGALINLQRKYLDEGVFKTVEIPKTDANGESIVNLELNDVIYTITVSKLGQILGTFKNLKAVCQTPAISTCTINLNSFSTSVEPTDFTTTEDFSFTITYNKTTRVIETNYNVPSGSSPTVKINATLADSLGTTEVCSDSLTSSAGVLTCTIPPSFGNGSAFITLTKDSDLITKGSLSLDQSSSEVYGVGVMFLSVFLFLTLIGLGLGDNPVTMGIFLILGVILSVALNLTNTVTDSFIGVGATMLWIVVAIIIIIIKGSNRQ